MQLGVGTVSHNSSLVQRTHQKFPRRPQHNARGLTLNDEEGLFGKATGAFWYRFKLQETLCLVSQTCNFQLPGRLRQEVSRLKASLGNLAKPCAQRNKTGGCGSVIKHLPSMCCPCPEKQKKTNGKYVGTVRILPSYCPQRSQLLASGPSGCRYRPRATLVPFPETFIYLHSLLILSQFFCLLILKIYP